jgi:glutamate-1-semialdehyde aminotransferase
MGAPVSLQLAALTSAPCLGIRALNTTRSQELFAAAQTLMPGGVSSPVRAFDSVGGKPVVFDRVKGAYAWDVDGNRYIDYIGSWGPAICGHAPPRGDRRPARRARQGHQLRRPLRPREHAWPSW